MTRKIDEEKYKKILKRLAQGESQKTIVIAEKCSYGTISSAKKWDKSWKSSTTTTTESQTKIVVSIPNFWLDRLNEDIISGIWKDYSDAILDIVRTYFRVRVDKTPKPLNMRQKVLKEIKEVSQLPKKNLHGLE